MLEEFETEMRKQLKRQSAAHREHLTDVLDAHTTKLNAEHKTDLEEKLRRERLLHGNELAKVSSHLRGVESVVDSVSNVERNSRKTQELWLAVQSLNAVLNEDMFNGRTKNLWPEIASIAKLAGDSFIQDGFLVLLLKICEVVESQCEKFSESHQFCIFISNGTD